MILLDGKKLAAEIQSNLKDNIQKLTKKPKLCVVLIGNDYASEKYVSHKIKACEKVGIESSLVRLNENIGYQDLKDRIDILNQDKSVSAILVQFPLPKQFSKKEVANWIDYRKDADGLNDINFGKLAKNSEGIFACTAKGIIRLLKEYGIELQAKHVVVISRSLIVGKPTSLLFINEKATVTVLHRYSTNLEEHTKKADIVVSATGKAQFIKEHMIKKGAIVVDVGITQDENKQICGDVDFEKVKNLCSYITPVPGGIGPMTIAMLLENTYFLHLKYHLENETGI